MNKKKLIFLLLLFAVLEAAAIFYLLGPSLFRNVAAVPKEIRLGIVLDSPEEVYRWEPLLNEINNHFNCRMIPYYTANGENAVTGLLHGALDLIYTDPYIYLKTSEKNRLRPWFYQKLSPREKQLRHSTLLLTKKINALEDTKKMRIVFVAYETMISGKVPYLFLESKFLTDPRKWFSEIQITAMPEQAFELLFSGKTDIVSCDPRVLPEIEKKYPKDFPRLETLWNSIVLPENLMFSKDSISLDISKILEHIVEEKNAAQETVNKNVLSLVPVDYSYRERMSLFKNYISPESPNNVFGR